MIIFLLILILLAVIAPDVVGFVIGFVGVLLFWLIVAGVCLFMAYMAFSAISGAL